MRTAPDGQCKRLFVDLDNTLVDFASGIDALGDAERRAYAGRYDECPGIFARMAPLPGAIDAFVQLADVFDTYILSTAPWRNPSAWSDKLQWVHRHLGSEPGSPAYKRLILSHHKDLAIGDFLVDDRPNNGAQQFTGQWLAFGSPQFPTWPVVTQYLLDRA